MERIPSVQGPANKIKGALKAQRGSLKKLAAGLMCLALVGSGCATKPGLTTGSAPPAAVPRLDIIVPVFDPGLSGSDTGSSTQVWPELRRAEAVRFAHKLKLALEETGAFGAVRVTPDATATGDLYVLGRIEQSNGEDVRIAIEARDVSGARWMEESFAHTVEKGFHASTRNQGKDPYDPVFENAARSLVDQLLQRRPASLERIRMLTELRFGASLAEEAFSEHLKTGFSGEVVLAGYPSDDDPMLLRTRAVRVRDQLFVDDLQDNYRAFSDKMNTSYLVWQEQSLLEIQAHRKARQKAVLQGVGAAVLLGLGALAVLSAKAGESGKVLVGAAAGVAGTALLFESFQTSAEMKVHRDAIKELGESIDLDLAPQVVRFESETKKLTGTAKEQFAQWRAFLKKIYEQERTPDVNL